MKKNISLLFFTFLSIVATSQNLVVNPSFEQTASNCANFGGEGFFTDLNGSWDNASNNVEGDSCSSPDLFSSCNTVFGSPGPTHMPNSALGYQYSRTGTRHAGIITHEALDEYREYIQGRTTQPLQAGVTYCVSFYVSLGNGVTYATDNMGIYFSNTQYQRDPCPGQTNSGIYVTPQLNYNCAPITDTTNWVRLQWDYTAVGGEQYFVIGNFFNNSNTNIVTVGSNFINPYAYYFIDDVSIVPATCCFADLPATQVVCLEDAAFNLTATGGVGSNCSGSVSGTWSGTGITNASAGTFDPSVAGIGTHTLTYSMSCGFSESTTVIVSACAALTVCVETNGDLTVSGGTGPYTWYEQITGQDCSACQDMFPLPPCSFPPGCAVEILEWSEYTTGTTITPPGTYPIQVTDSDGGVLEITGIASLPPCSGSPCTLGIDVLSSQDACDGQNNGSITVVATGNIGSVQYAWNSSPPQNGVTASGLAAGEYVVTATDQQGCETTETIILGTESITADAGEDQVICKGESADLTATGGVGYVWSSGGGPGTVTGASITVSPGTTTTYTVTVTGAGGCPDTDDVTITVLQTPIVDILTLSATLCNNDDAIQLQGDPPGGTFSGPGVSNDMFDPSVAGPGVHTITYIYYEEPECPGEGQVTMTVDFCTGIADTETLEGLTVYPNPGDGAFNLSYSGGLIGMANVLVTDMTGRTVIEPTVHELSGMQLSLDLRTLADGQYLLHITQNGKVLNTTRLTKR